MHVIVRVSLLHEFTYELEEAEAAHRTRNASGEDAASDQVIWFWSRRFENGKEDTEDERRQGRPEVGSNCLKSSCNMSRRRPCIEKTV